MGKRIVVTAIWVFISVVALADVYVTWTFRSSVLEWEANPIAALLFRWWGPLGVVVYRVGWLAYAKIISRTHSRLSWLVTPLWGVGHLYLVIALIQVYPDLVRLQRARTAQATVETVASGRNAAQHALSSGRRCERRIQPDSDLVVARACHATFMQGEGYRPLLNGDAAKPGAPRRFRAMLRGWMTLAMSV